MEDYITTYTKVHFTPLNPKEEEIRIEDIAHALSLMTRANGHFPEFYSVGQHCIDCAKEALRAGDPTRLALAALLHDAGEAYLADITRPVKQHLTDFKAIEQRLLDAIYRKYLGRELSGEERAEVKRLDDTLLYYEFYHHMGERLQESAPTITEIPDFRFRGFWEVEEEYLELFRKLWKERI